MTGDEYADALARALARDRAWTVTREARFLDFSCWRPDVVVSDGPDCCAIECKWQQTTGSTWEKVYASLHAKMPGAPVPAFLVWGGPGWPGRARSTLARSHTTALQWEPDEPVGLIAAMCEAKMSFQHGIVRHVQGGPTSKHAGKFSTRGRTVTDGPEPSGQLWLLR